MTKRYSVPKNRYLAVCLVNVPFFYEPDEPVRRQHNRRLRAGVYYATLAMALAGGIGR